MPQTNPEQRDQSRPPRAPHEASVPDTLISLIVAFVIAMTFRGFVVEGFVIPTGSMAPTLLGEHTLWTSDATGYTYAIDSSDRSLAGHHFDIPDPMLGADIAVGDIGRAEVVTTRRPGDRVLVLKWLYTFVDPNRFDVIVFKNPTNPAENYIKRLVGLPNEEIWLADGDVFTRAAGALNAPFEVRRKPDSVQRDVWQMIHSTDWPAERNEAGGDVSGPFWQGHGWEARRRALRFDAAGPAELRWNNRRRPLNDWLVYNAFAQQPSHGPFNVSDLRISASIVPDALGLEAALEIRARACIYQFAISQGRAAVRMRDVGSADDIWKAETAAEIDALEPGEPTNIEFWHVDQRMAIYIDGDCVCELVYDWSPRERLARATGISVEDAIERARRPSPWIEFKPSEPEIVWSFDGSPLSLHHVRIDRDLYYQPDEHDYDPAPGTHPHATAITGPDHFFMLGDNSAHSLDSRKWGDPHEMIAEQIDDTPFVVNRELIVGRAWAVYFPAPFGLTERGARFIPDVGRVRLIR